MERGSSPLSILLMNINAAYLTATIIITCFHELRNPVFEFIFKKAKIFFTCFILKQVRK